MTEKLQNLSLWQKVSRTLKSSATIATICLTLTGCLSDQEKLQRQTDKVKQLERELIQQSENYGIVATQENIQQDLKDEWADLSINEDIWYSHEYADDQEIKIAKTKKKLNKEQRKLARMWEKSWKPSNTVNFDEERLNPGKYEYIPEEFRRSREAQAKKNN